MPLYEYSCPECGDFEVLQRITEKPLTRHAQCGKRVRRKVSISSFQLKGGGWYADLYGSTKPTASPAPGASAPAPAAKGA